MKAIGAAGGDLDGRPVPNRPASAEDLARLGELIRAQGGKPAAPSPDQMRRTRWMASQTREFSIPRELGVDIVCNSRGEARTMCLDHLVPPEPQQRPYGSTPMGTYQPLPYLLPGLAARTAGEPVGAIRRARFVFAAICLGLIGLAALVTARGAGGGVAALGLVATLSPAVLLLGVTVNPSGPEVAGAICFAAGLFAVTRPDGRWWAAWAAVGAGGVALACSRSFGPLFVVVTLIVVAALRGRAGLRSALAPPRAPLAVAGGLVVAASVFSVAWELDKQPHPGAGRGDVRPGLDDAVDGLGDLAKQVVGVFGTALDVPISGFAYALWALLLAGVVGLALRLGDARERATLAGVFAAALIALAVLAIAIRPTGFPVQTRHLLPIVVLFPIGAGEVLRRHAAALSPALVRGATIAAVSVAVLVHLDAWYENAEAWSGWTPPGSWAIWTALLCAAAAAYVAAAWIATSSNR